MSFIIRTVYGSTSDGLYKLTRTLTRIGTSEDSDLTLAEDGLPETALMLVQREQQPIKAYCQVGNSVRIGGKLLKKDEVVDWTLNEEIDVCNAVRLVLEEETKETTRRPSLDSSLFSGRSLRVSGADASEPRPRRSLKGGEAVVSKTTSRVSFSHVGDASESEKNAKSTSNLSNSTQIAVTCLCALGCVVILFFSFAMDSSVGGSGGLSWSQAYYLLNSAQLQNPFENPAETASFDDAKLAKTFQIAMINEQVDSYRSLVAYRALQKNLLVKYKEKRANNDASTSEDDPYRRSYQKLNAFIDSRVDALSTKLKE